VKLYKTLNHGNQMTITTKYYELKNKHAKLHFQF